MQKVSQKVILNKKKNQTSAEIALTFLTMVQDAINATPHE